MKKQANVVSVLLFILAGAVCWYFFAIPAPKVSLTPDNGLIGARRSFSLNIDASRGMLKRLAVSAEQGGKSVDVLVKDYPSGSRKGAETFYLDKAGLKEGALSLKVSVTSRPARFGAGKSTELTRSFTLENRPPDVSVISVAHNINQGGAALVVYTVSKEVEKTGVTLGDRFFPGYRQSGNYFACLFPLPYDMPLTAPVVVAVDRAGNERLTTVTYHQTPKTFTTDRIDLKDVFLAKIGSEFKSAFPDAKTPLELFLKVNREQRQQDRKKLVDYGLKTSSTPLWQGAFLRMPNSAALGGFAQARTYTYNGAEVDRQTHLGFDLASLAHAAVPAANRGKVIHAGSFGIYGQCVIIDHGLGLQSIYGHLSQVGVKIGDSVNKGQTIGATGATGMAGGDHLHFELMISGQAVNPVEWWDAHWIKDNVAGQLASIPVTVVK